VRNAIQQAKNKKRIFTPPRKHNFMLNQADFAKTLGISQGQLSKYEVGQSAPTLEILLNLKVHSGKSVDWILTGGE
jgi:transcriptional regulator with XRE-family HTH domain